MKKNIPIITIGITTFNEKNLLIDSWNSVLNQNSDAWEAVMVLDGGGDKMTKSLFHSIEHPKLKKYIFKKNKGPFGTRSKAIEISNTPWYYQLDSDDLLPQNAIKNIIDTIKSNPEAEYIYGNCEVFSYDKTNIEKPIKDEEQLCIKPLFLPQSPILKTLFNKVGGFAKDIYINADWDFWISVHEMKVHGAYIDDVIYRYRRRQNNVGNRFFFIRENIINKIIDRHPIYFHSNNRKNKALFNVYEKIARNYRKIGERFKAGNYAREALKYGEELPVFISILEEEKMSYLRYKIRRIGRYISFISLF